jgi:hypothetical protein
MSVYFLVLWSHFLRGRAGLAPFYAVIGGITAVMSWVTDAGIKVDIAGVTFMVGSRVLQSEDLCRHWLQIPADSMEDPLA